jgi:HK97 family phage major capsid protein
MKFDDQIKAAYDAAEVIQHSAEDENRAPTEEELSQMEAHIQEAEDLKAQKAKHEELSAKLAGSLKPQSRRSSASKPTDVSVSAPEWHKDPAKGFKNPREFFSAIMKNNKTGAKDERLDFLSAQGTDEQSVQSDPHGGFLVPAAFSPNLLEIMPENDPTIGRTTQIPLEAPVVEIPSRVDTDHSTSVAGGLTVARKQETVDGATSRMEFEKVTLKANSLFGAAFVTEELLNDSPMSVAALLGNGFQQAFTDHLFNEKLNGTGVGEYEGVTNSPAFVEQPKEGSQAADRVTKTRSGCRITMLTRSSRLSVVMETAAATSIRTRWLRVALTCSSVARSSIRSTPPSSAMRMTSSA